MNPSNFDQQFSEDCHIFFIPYNKSSRHYNKQLQFLKKFVLEL